MKILIQPNSWSCLPTSLAMLLDESIEDIINEVGHNGSEIVNDAPEPYNRRSFHIQELVKLCFNRNMALIQFDREMLLYKEDCVTVNYGSDMKYINQIMKENNGVLLGRSQENKNHAVAWNNIKNCVFDPNGTIYAKGFFSIESFLLLRELK